MLALQASVRLVLPQNRKLDDSPIAVEPLATLTVMLPGILPLLPTGVAVGLLMGLRSELRSV